MTDLYDYLDVSYSKENRSLSVSQGEDPYEYLDDEEEEDDGMDTWDDGDPTYIQGDDE